VVRNTQLPGRVESRHIDYIPAGARHGRPWHQFAFWFGGNVNVFNVVMGAVTVSIGLTFWPALIAIAVGTLISALTILGWIVIFAVPSVVIGIFGYRWIHREMQATAVVVGVALVIMFAQGLQYGALPGPP
jgi:purine-cytosine permease-like protein